MWDIPACSSVRNRVGERFSLKDRLVVGWRTKKWQGHTAVFNSQAYACGVINVS